MFCLGLKTVRDSDAIIDRASLDRHLAYIVSLKRYDIERERVFNPAESFSSYTLLNRQLPIT